MSVFVRSGNNSGPYLHPHPVQMLIVGYLAHASGMAASARNPVRPETTLGGALSAEAVRKRDFPRGMQYNGREVRWERAGFGFCTLSALRRLSSLG
jgi:hypothetical protein